MGRARWVSVGKCNECDEQGVETTSQCSWKRMETHILGLNECWLEMRTDRELDEEMDEEERKG